MTKYKIIEVGPSTGGARAGYRGKGRIRKFPLLPKITKIPLLKDKFISKILREKKMILLVPSNF